MAKRPSFQFYPPDWRRDPGLRLCSMAARGLWVEMMCLMHEGEPYGHLTVLGRAMTAPELARMVGESARDVQRWQAELRGNGVFSETEGGVAYSRRMVRDEVVREARAMGGSAGAQHGTKGASHGVKGGRPKGGKITPLTDEQKPPPSSSSSFSSSSSEPIGSLDDANASSATKRGSRLSDGWMPGPLPANVEALAAQWPPGRLDRELDQFRAYWTSLTGKNATKLDWDKTWHNRIRDQHDRIMRENRNGRTTDDGHGPSVGAALDWINGR